MTGKSEKDMVIYLAGESQAAEPEPLPSFDELTPREIVIELDKYIVGQNLAKKARLFAWQGEPQPAEPEPLPSFDELTPREIVIELDKYIVGQNLAKKAV